MLTLNMEQLLDMYINNGTVTFVPECTFALGIWCLFTVMLSERSEAKCSVIKIHIASCFYVRKVEY